MVVFCNKKKRFRWKRFITTQSLCIWNMWTQATSWKSSHIASHFERVVEKWKFLQNSHAWLSHLGADTYTQYTLRDKFSLHFKIIRYLYQIYTCLAVYCFQKKKKHNSQQKGNKCFSVLWVTFIFADVEIMTELCCQGLVEEHIKDNKPPG